MRILAQRHHAVSNIAGGRHLKLVAQSARASAVVRNSNDGGKIRNLGSIGASCHKLFEPGKKRCQTRPTTNGNDVHPSFDLCHSLESIESPLYLQELGAGGKIKL